MSVFAKDNLRGDVFGEEYLLEFVTLPVGFSLWCLLLVLGPMAGMITSPV